MSSVLGPVVAGYFYPRNADELRNQVRGFLADAPPPGEAMLPPKALIAPHAGYIYSGPVAGVAYASLRPIRDLIRRVVVLAPSHRVGFAGLARPSATAFRTPLGDVPVDTEALKRISGFPQVHLLDLAFEGEHSLEVQLPFLQESLDAFRLVPLLVGDCSPEQVDEVLEVLWGGEETLIVVSSDLSHYLDYEAARRMDSAASRAIEALDTKALGRNHACGRLPVSGLLLAARRHGLRATTLDLRNSGDTAGARDRVVGYGAYAFHVPPSGSAH